MSVLLCFKVRLMYIAYFVKPLLKALWLKNSWISHIDLPCGIVSFFGYDKFRDHRVHVRGFLIQTSCYLFVPCFYWIHVLKLPFISPEMGGVLLKVWTPSNLNLYISSLVSSHMGWSSSVMTFIVDGKLTSLSSSRSMVASSFRDDGPITSFNLHPLFSVLVAAPIQWVIWFCSNIK